MSNCLIPDRIQFITNQIQKHARNWPQNGNASICSFYTYTVFMNGCYAIEKMLNLDLVLFFSISWAALLYALRIGSGMVLDDVVLHP
jgi:hypothetical protein